MIRYFPILKGKRGEYTALAHLDHVTRQRVTPIIELLGTPKVRQSADRPLRLPKSVDQHVADQASRIARSWGTDQLVLIDFTHLPETPTSDNLHPAAAVMRHLWGMRVRAAPVVRPTSSFGLITALRDAGALEHGAAMRLAPTDYDYGPERIDVLLSHLRVGREDVDALIDFGQIEDAGVLRQGMTRAALADQVDHPWRSLSYGAASFPLSLSGMDESDARFPRIEWAAWNNIDLSALGREVGFADYGIRAYTPPVEGGTEPIPNLRYTVDDQWLVLRAKAVERSYYPSLARSLVHGYPEVWAGANHCTGCRSIVRCADGDKGRTAEQAIQFGMIHHLTCVTQQLANSVAA